MARVEKGTVAIPGDYFLRMAKADYRDYQLALPREFYQNSIDAGASTIFVKSDSNERTIEVVDNGCGMSKATIKNKLLVLGGSKKRSGSVGAFGKAKEILFFSWDRYTIKSRQWVVIGNQASYSIQSQSTTIDGTICTIWIPESENFDYLVKCFTTVAQKIETDCRIIVDGFDVPESYEKGELVKSLDWCDLYQNQKVESQYIRVRINGLWMFNNYVSNNKLGLLTVELKPSSLECLTSNRDSLGWRYHDDLSEVIGQLMTSATSFLEDGEEIVVEKIVGEGPISVFSKAKDLFSRMVSGVRGGRKDEVLRDLRDYVADYLANSNFESLTAGMQLDAEMARIKASIKGRNLNIANFNFEDISDRLAFIGYAPDFLIRRKKNEPVDDYMGTRKAKVLAHMWTEIIKQVLLDNDLTVSFVAGFTFSSKEQASHERVDGVDHFYLNPDLLLADLPKEEQKKAFKNRQLLVQYLKDMAIHEVAHIKERYHDEDFVNEYHRLNAGTFKSNKLYFQIGYEVMCNA
jgi:hypothetical protein